MSFRQTVTAVAAVCALGTGAATAQTFAETAMAQAEARLGTVPSVPDAAPLRGQALIDRVSGGPYALTIYSAGIVATSTWNLAENRAYGSFHVLESGAEGDWSLRAFVENDKLCTEQSAGVVCQTIYAWQDGFMEVTDAGEVHAVTVPVD